MNTGDQGSLVVNVAPNGTVTWAPDLTSSQVQLHHRLEQAQLRGLENWLSEDAKRTSRTPPLELMVVLSMACFSCVSTHFIVQRRSIQQRSHGGGRNSVRGDDIERELYSIVETHRVTRAQQPLLHRVVVSQLRSVSQDRTHHRLRAFLVKHAPNSFRIDRGHLVEHGAVGQKARLINRRARPAQT